jgi:hypothetical protein
MFTSSPGYILINTFLAAAESSFPLVEPEGTNPEDENTTLAKKTDESHLSTPQGIPKTRVKFTIEKQPALEEVNCFE